MTAMVGEHQTELPDLEKLTPEELADLRARIDRQIVQMRAQKAAIQSEVDRRYSPPGPAGHTIGLGGG